MEQTEVAGKTKPASVYRKFIEAQKRKQNKDEHESNWGIERK